MIRPLSALLTLLPHLFLFAPVQAIPAWKQITAASRLTGRAQTSYGSPLIPGSTNFSTAQPQFLLAPSAPTYPQPATGLELELGLGLGDPVVQSFTYADPMLFLDVNGKPHPVLRDLGFSGVLDGKIVWTWGDTLIGTPTSYYPTAVDSMTISVDLKKPFLSQDTAMTGAGIDSLIPVNKEEIKGGGYLHYGFGGTNIIETSPGNGLIYYLINHRAIGDLNGATSKLMGAGAAQVTLDKNNRPVVRRFGDRLWSSKEPTWGDVGIAVDSRDDNVYVFGHGPQGTEFGSYTFLCRVPRGHAADIKAYEYFDNSTATWTKKRFGDGTGGTLAITREMAVFGYLEMNQAAPFWSHWFRKWVWIHGDGFGSSPVLLKTADHLQGPWKDHGEIAVSKPDKPNDGNNLRYAIMGHPEFDDTGRTVVVTWTWENRIYGGVVEWAPLV